MSRTPVPRLDGAASRTVSIHGPAAPVRRVLMLTHRVPFPPDRGDRILTYPLLKHLSQYFEVDLACTSDQPVDAGGREALREGGVAGRVSIWHIDPLWGRVRAAAALMSGRPATPSAHLHRGLTNHIVRWHQDKPFDAVLTVCTGMIDYARILTNLRWRPPWLRHPPCRHVLDLDDVDSMKWADFAASARAPMKWVYAAESRRLRRIEAAGADHFDAITVVSQAEAQLYRRGAGAHPGLEVVTNGVDLDYFRPLGDCPDRTIVFVGVLNYRPNVEGINWFVRQVMPMLRQRLPGAKLLIVGRDPSPPARDLAGHDGVQGVGSVPDVREFLFQSAAVIAPLRMAPDVQNKVLEAMASARAVVCSPQAARGRNLLVAAEPAQFVAHLERLLLDGSFRCRIAASARRRVETCHTWGAAFQPMVSLIRGRLEVTARAA